MLLDHKADAHDNHQIATMNVCLETNNVEYCFCYDTPHLLNKSVQDIV